jgi:decaprenyl-phosphate phosphoribosyltransferase
MYIGTSYSTKPSGAQAQRSNLQRLQDYISIARFDHWFKNLFVLPGIALAARLTDIGVQSLLFVSIAALLSAGLIASANYVINEWLDAPFDARHPLKCKRPAASGRIKSHFVYLEYVVLAVLGLALAYWIGRGFFLVSLLFLFMGLLYNVPPVRLKDQPYLDVISESVNNPIRFMLGWTAVVHDLFPPSSILLAFWMGGAFLMAVKRFAEYRFIGDPQRAGSYRQSFRYYSENKLLVSAFFFALCCTFFLGVFLVKYRIEFLLVFPFLALLFAWYLAIGLRPSSPAQSPEKLYRELGFVAYVTALVIFIALLLIVDFPVLQVLMEPVAY